MTKWSDTTVRKLPVKAKRYHAPDPLLPGHYVRVLPTGSKIYAAIARDPGGKQVWHTIGATALYRLDDAREAARGGDPLDQAGR